MLYAIVAIIIGLILLVWSADRFVDGASATALHFGVPKLLIGMLVIGFGTSAPELVVSATAAIQGNPGIALGNAYGSNIANIALILGFTAIISPILIDQNVLKKELPQLLFITIVSTIILSNGQISRLDAFLLLALFAVFMWLSIRSGIKQKNTAALEPIEINEDLPLPKAIAFLLVGLVLLIASSQLLVWGSVQIAEYFGVSDLIIGLTIVAVGTSLPELASSIAAARKNQHDLALGNILGSNMFNTLAVVGLAGIIHPLAVNKELFTRDIPVLLFLTTILFFFGYRYKAEQGYIKRWAGFFLVSCYIAYNSWIFFTIKS